MRWLNSHLDRVAYICEHRLYRSCCRSRLCEGFQTSPMIVPSDFFFCRPFVLAENVSNAFTNAFRQMRCCVKGCGVDAPCESLWVLKTVQRHAYFTLFWADGVMLKNSKVADRCWSSGYSSICPSVWLRQNLDNRKNSVNNPRKADSISLSFTTLMSLAWYLIRMGVNSLILYDFLGTCYSWPLGIAAWRWFG